MKIACGCLLKLGINCLVAVGLHFIILFLYFEILKALENTFGNVLSKMRLVGGKKLQVYIKVGIITYILGNKLSFSMRTAIVLILIKILNIFLLFSVLENYFYRAYQTSSPISDKPNSNLCVFFFKVLF